MSSQPPISLVETPLVQTYILYCSILAVKMLLMSPLTAGHRIYKGIFVSPEDIAIRPGAKVADDDEHINRVRRAHMNDLENIPVFFLVAGLYVLTEPTTWLATNLIRVFTAARLLHTFVYALVVIPQPSRAIAWGTGFFITIYMAFATGVSYITAI